ncbi:MAG: nicotinate phosphoribosyltransferase [Clostridiales bacterium 43-6]|nr:MAG: nicotinate phosphoribosyltransferase [Clostridiales bacterium 43-6]
MRLSPMLMTDFYKTIHHLAYVPDLDYLVSYWTPRMTRKEGIDKIILFGLQAFLKKTLIEEFQQNFFDREWAEVEAEYIRLVANTMTPQAADSTAMKSLHDLGYLPIRISAVPEGTRVPVKVPMIEVTNTVKGFGWLVNYLETLMSCSIWQPMTAASIAYQYREFCEFYYRRTVSDTVAEHGNSTEKIDFLPPVNALCGDFSMRGMSAPEAAMSTSAGHLTSFIGSATIPAILWLEQYYHCDCTKETVGKGVPSTEHSVMSSYGKDGEFDCYRHLICEAFPRGPLSIVSDTYDYWNVLTRYLPKLKNEILSRDGKVIIRGDSGDPVDIICGTFPEEIRDFPTIERMTVFYQKTNNGKHYGRVDGQLYEIVPGTLEGVKAISLTPEEKGTVELLWETFGGVVNDKGYKMLDRHIGAIYGDSITIDRAVKIWDRLSAKGFAITNVVLGIGSFTYQYNTRDTFGFALKATNSIIAGKETPIFKDPITDRVDGSHFKKSQKGMCYVYWDNGEIKYRDELSFEDMGSVAYGDNLIQPVFENGRMLREFTLKEIRDRLYDSF